MFEQSFAWLTREFQKARREKNPARLRELAVRNHQLGADVIRFMERNA